MSQSPDLSWTEEVGEDVVAAMSPAVRELFIAVRQLHQEMQAEDGGD